VFLEKPFALHRLLARENAPDAGGMRLPLPAAGAPHGNTQSVTLLPGQASNQIIVPQIHEQICQFHV
jgi:hypothetical protein